MDKIKIRLTALLLFVLTVNGNLRAQDWPIFGRYMEPNQNLKDSTVNVINLRDSITDFWIEKSSEFFHQNHYVDRGISGQTSPQMLLRFRQDVISLKPKAVVILCGTNDIAGNTGPSTLEMIEDNIQSMSQLAKANNIKVILCSVLPANRFSWRPELQPADSIIGLNTWIRDYAKTNNYGYVDYYKDMVDDKKGLKAEYSPDGVHPNKEGYQVMERLVQPVIEQALNTK